MTGFITEKHWKEIEANFPGAHSLYESLSHKPNTFLEFINLYNNRPNNQRRFFMKTRKIIALLVLALSLSYCGGSDSGTDSTTAENGTGGSSGTGSTGATGNGTTTDTTVSVSWPSKLQAVASALVPNVNGSGTSASTSSQLSALQSEEQALTLQSSDDWSTYLESANVYVLTDIFGDPEVYPAVVTKMRVLLKQFKQTLSDISYRDSEFKCKGAAPISAGNSIPIAFYGNVDNGTDGDRAFRCLLKTANDRQTIIYGKDSHNVIRVAVMSDDTNANSEDVPNRGNSVRIAAVTYATYAEVSENGVNANYLDLQFAHASSYNGVDGDFETGDDMIFKSRSRITGRVTLDNDDKVTSAVGDFAAIKYDGSPNVTTRTVTKAIGRGDYRQGGHSLFKIDSTVTALSAIPGTFCIQQPVGNSTPPLYADAANCTTLEADFAWGNNSFPFSLNSSSEKNFTDRKFFEGNDTDLVSSSGENFTIPSYQ
ncbi:MAG: hypothetical protein Q7S98_01475 [Deltaproteobacteria bacterium]|nr:hypothetical protein [Deltaproteobacteria bacterium]